MQKHRLPAPHGATIGGANASLPTAMRCMAARRLPYHSPCHPRCSMIVRPVSRLPLAAKPLQPLDYSLPTPLESPRWLLGRRGDGLCTFIGPHHSLRDCAFYRARNLTTLCEIALPKLPAISSNLECDRTSDTGYSPKAREFARNLGVEITGRFRLRTEISPVGRFVVDGAAKIVFYLPRAGVVMTDYEKIAASATVEGEIVQPPVEEPQSEKEEPRYLPVTHDKYQGLASAKGYDQNGGVYRIKKTRYNHEAMIDEIIADPTVSLKDLAAKFEVTPQWMYMVYGSDAFQAALAKRRDDLTDPFLIATIEERFMALATQSIDVISKKLADTENPDLALKGLDIASKALGFGARVAGGNQNNQFIIQLPPKSEDAASWAASHNPAMKQLPPEAESGHGNI